MLGRQQQQQQQSKDTSSSQPMETDMRLRLRRGAAKRKLVEEDEDHEVKMETGSVSETTSSTALDTFDFDEEEEDALMRQHESGSAAAGARKSVSINEEKNEYRPDTMRRLSHSEKVSCWFSDTEIAMFRSQATKAAAKLFSARQQRPIQRLFARNSGKNSRQVAPHKHNNKRTKASASPERHVDDSIDNTVLTHALVNRTKKSLSNTYKSSNKVRTEEEFDHLVHPSRRSSSELAEHQALVASYQEVPDEVCLAGLEVFIMYGIRGESSTQVRYILEAAKKKSIHHPEQLGHWMQVISQFISLPSRVFVRELAMAQADALAQ